MHMEASLDQRCDGGRRMGRRLSIRGVTEGDRRGGISLKLIYTVFRLHTSIGYMFHIPFFPKPLVLRQQCVAENGHVFRYSHFQPGSIFPIFVMSRIKWWILLLAAGAQAPLLKKMFVRYRRGIR